MKVGIIIPNVIEKAPYIQYYTDIFDSLGIDYKYICWNRSHLIPSSFTDEKAAIFQLYSPESSPLFKTIQGYWLFSRFVIRCLKKEEFNCLVIHTIVISVFLGKFLKRHYSNNYFFDIRDYSPLYPFVKRRVENIIKNSAFTTISSLGYKIWLPQNCDYVMGHNIRKDFVEKALTDSSMQQINKKEIVVLTIGQIRDFTSNSRLISSLGNRPGIKVVFAGNGAQKENLELFSKGKYSNVFFKGKYKKEEEPMIARSSDFLNIVLPVALADRTLMSNRFYLSLVNRIPMIVNEESVQAGFVKKFNLGMIVSSNDDIYEKLVHYTDQFNYATFADGCLTLLNRVKEDIELFENRVIKKVMS